MPDNFAHDRRQPDPPQHARGDQTDSDLAGSATGVGDHVRAPDERSERDSVRAPRLDSSALLDRLSRVGMAKLAHQRDLTVAEAGLLSLLTVFPDESPHDAEAREVLDARRKAGNAFGRRHTYRTSVG